MSSPEPAVGVFTAAVGFGGAGPGLQSRKRDRHMPLACLIARSTPGPSGHSRTAQHTPSPARPAARIDLLSSGSTPEQRQTATLAQVPARPTCTALLQLPSSVGARHIITGFREAMSYTWQEIEQDWLGGSGVGLAASPDEILSAFNEVAGRFGREWIEATRTKNGISSRGLAPTLYIVTMARLLRSLDGLPNTAGLLEKVSSGSSDARAELIAIDLIRTENPAAVVEVEPEIQVGGRNRIPDFRAQLTSEPWTYVEVTNPNTSGAQEEVRRGIAQITGLVRDCTGSFALEVFLKREPSATELGSISDMIMREHQTIAKEAVELPANLGTMYWNYQPPGGMVLDDHGEPYTPRLSSGAVAGITDQHGHIDQHRHITVRWPFTDVRAETFIRHEARQLPTDAPGLIMIYTSGTVGAMKAWRTLIERRLQPNLNTRISAVCLFSSALRETVQGEDWKAECKVILNPHARIPLPQWIIEQLKRFPSSERDI